MVGVVLVTHPNLGEEFIRSAEMICGKFPNLVPVSIDTRRAVEELREEIARAVKSVDTGKGVLILTDMFGGTPSNLAISVMSQPKVEVLAGINLPMLIKLAKVRETVQLEEAVTAAQEAGRKYCTIASRVLNGK